MPGDDHGRSVDRTPSISDAEPMARQRERRRLRQEEAQRAATRLAPDAGHWKVLFETRDESEWNAHIRRLRASRTRIDWTAVRLDRLCGRQTHPTTFRLSLFIPTTAPHPAEDSSG
jgi:hypothetical protein